MPNLKRIIQNAVDTLILSDIRKHIKENDGLLVGYASKLLGVKDGRDPAADVQGEDIHADDGYRSKVSDEGKLTLPDNHRPKSHPVPGYDRKEQR